ncbi:hypothetical protein FGIG_10621 [Fasciola gigantica]|uniref:Uncharacterized protein n=1 Tax=Fasciola gigantica TaxID=46835 RepID=A0A504YTI7_FASGI|nr:hypothetical protein FGIG_10621 [Fasciola gigantica]
MATPNLLRLFATAIQVASNLSTEMRFTDLHAAFKMTCELQQHIANVSFRRSIGTNSVTNLEEPSKSDPGNPSSNSESASPGMSTAKQNGDKLPSPNPTASEAGPSSSGDSQVVIQIAAPSHEIASELPKHPKVGKDQPRTDNDCPRISARRRHRLVALETLHPDAPFNSYNIDQTTCPVTCKPCHLRMGPGTESNATMACPACPNQPAICSAQCFRWWHARFPNLMTNDENAQTSDESSLEINSCSLPTLQLSDPPLSDITGKATSRSVRGKNRRKNLQFSRVKRAGLRRHYAKRAAVLRSTRNAVTSDPTGMIPMLQMHP